MSTAPERVAESELAIFLQTNEPVPFRPLFEFLKEVEMLARRPYHLGGGAVMEVLAVQTGTKLITITFSDVMAVASFALAAASFRNDLANNIKQPTGNLAENAAAMCALNGVVEYVVTTSEGPIRISRDEMPAYETFKSRQADQVVTAELHELIAPLSGYPDSNVFDSIRNMEGVENVTVAPDGDKYVITLSTRYMHGQARGLQGELYRVLGNAGLLLPS